MRQNAQIMKRTTIFILLCLFAIAASAQGLVKGKVLDKQTSEPLGFVNVKVTRQDGGKFAGGGMTDSDGNFSVDGLEYGN